MLYASLLFLPIGASPIAPGPGQLRFNYTGVCALTVVDPRCVSRVSVCPRPVICSDGAFQIFLLAVARLSSFVVHVALVVSFLSKCYCLVYFLRSTALAIYLPFQYMHDLHRAQGLAFFWGSLLHTVAHLIRYAVRHSVSNGANSIGTMLGHHTSVSGLVATILLIIATLPFYAVSLVKRWNVSFETRHWLHLLAIPMLVALNQHTRGAGQDQHVGIMCGLLLAVWALDRSYLFFCKTHRIEEVRFNRLSDGTVQMIWRTPQGSSRPRAGEYVRVMVSSISNEFHPFSTFDYLPLAALNVDGGGQREKQPTMSPGRLRRASTVSAARVFARVADQMRSRVATENAPATADAAPILEEEKEAMLHAQRAADSESAHTNESSRSLLEKIQQVATARLHPQSALPLATDLPPPTPTGGVLPHSISSSSARDAHGDATLTALTIRVEKHITAQMRRVDDTLENLSMGMGLAPTYSQVLIGPFGDWTRTLSSLVAELSQDGSKWVAPCWIQGPFASPFNACLGYGRLILVVTGIGLSAALPIVQQLHGMDREVFLVWVTPSKEHISFAFSMLLSCTSTLIFYDGDEDIGAQKEMAARHPHIRIYDGRPDVPKIINWLVLSQYPLLGRKLEAGLAHAVTSAQSAATSREPVVVHLSSIRDDEEEELDGLSYMRLPSAREELYKSDQLACLLKQKLPVADRSAWALLYCGNVPSVKEAVKLSANEWKFLYSEESFAW